MEPFYRPSFERHRHSLVINGFYTRELDADDFAFLEYVKKCGVANGSLPSSNVVLLEELQFWHLPYTVMPRFDRQIGRTPRLVDHDDYRAMKRAKRDAWHAQRLIREQQKAIAAAELEREQREWEAAQQKRKARELISDAEWEAAAPRKVSFGKTVDRHYVPQWKLDELHRAKTEARAVSVAKSARRRHQQEVREAAAAARARAKQREHERQLLQEAEAAVRAQAEEQARIILAAREQRDRELQSARKAEAVARRSQSRSQQQAEAIIAARKAIDDSERLARAWREKMYSLRYPTADHLKHAILRLTGSTPGYVFTREEILKVLDCNEAALDYCLEALVSEGQLRKAKVED
jgi:hypothetical protein